jgi:APA family basic amino acid/polyamine antiporter
MTEKDDGLRKTLSPLDAVMIVVGNVVGVGIFTTTGFMASDLPDARWIMLAWLFGGFLTLLGALTYGELGAMFPRAGGDYVYLREAYGPWAGFLVGWIGFLIINPASIAALALGLAEYLLPVVVRDPAALPPLASKLVAVAAILVLTLLNYISVRWASRAQNLVSGLNLLIIFCIVAAGLLWGTGDWAHFECRSEGSSIFGILGPPMVSVFFTYSGWFVSAYVASEMKDPQKTLPFSLIVSSMIVTLVYVVINVFYIYALPIPEMKGVVDIGRRASEALLGSGVSVFVSVMIMFAVLGSLNSVILTAPRIYFAMARDGIFPGIFGTVHPEHQTPQWSIAAQAVISCALVLIGAFYQLLSYSVFFMLLTSVATAAAVFVMRRRNPELERPYKVWGYPSTTLIFVVSYIWIAIRIFLYNPLNAVMGICITLTGVPFYLYWRRGKAVDA